MKALRLGTRKSALAQAQANWTAGQLRAAFPDVQVKIVLITTSGDTLSSSPAATGRGSMGSPPETAGNDGRSGGLKALFTKEIEEALLDRRIDLAVHSLKDMSAELPPGLIIGAVPPREDPRDVWISKSGIPFQNIRAGARIGTGAVRRQAQLKHIRPDIEIIAIRGNVDTRLKKLGAQSKPLDSGFRRNDDSVALDGIVLALAGLKRLGHAAAVTEILPIEMILPAVGQGCLGIQIRDRDAAMLPFMKSLDHAASHAAALCERSFLKKLGGSCQMPIAGHASIEGGELTIRGLVISPDGKEMVSARETGRPFDAEGIGWRLGQNLIDAGADKLI